MGGIYVHIPFCKTHCTYCAFYSELLRQSQGSDSFVEALVSEIASEGRCEGDTLYFGGGTPSVLTAEQIGKIVRAIDRQRKSLGLCEASAMSEFTMEVNPDDIVKGGGDYARALRSCGVNRISMGVQSFDDAILHKMGRRHTAKEALKAWEILREAGFENVSIDLIFGFSERLDIELIRQNLLVMGLPEHISCYQLSIEQGSGLDKIVGKGLYKMPDDENCEAQYLELCDLLGSLGYEHYEISNWALPGFRSKHNSSYWNHSPYIGFGPGAHSLILADDGTMERRWNEADLCDYIMAAQTGSWNSVRGGERLSKSIIREEQIFLGLRTCEGIPAELIPPQARGRLVPSESSSGNLRIPESLWFVSDSIIVDMI